MMGLQIDEESNHGILKCKRVHIMARSEKHSDTRRWFLPAQNSVQSGSDVVDYDNMSYDSDDDWGMGIDEWRML
jgi:hypothetical protein